MSPRVPLTLMFFVVCLGWIVLAIWTQEVSRPYRSNSTPDPVRTYSLTDLLGTPEPTPELELMGETYVVYQPTPFPTPVYIHKPIPVDLDEDCWSWNGCLTWVCHYEEDDVEGYHYSVGPRGMAAHIAQHPNDYPDYSWDTYEARDCEDLDNGIDPTEEYWNE